MTIKIITQPAEEPVTLDEAKLHCKVDVDDDDALITGLIVAAREYCERMSWRSFLTQTLQFFMDAWPRRNYIEIPRPPLQGVASVKYFDEDDVEYILDPAAYYVDYYREPGRVVLRAEQTWPDTTLRSYNAVSVEFDAGYETVEDVPQHYKQAMLLLVGHWYENREATTVGAVNRAIEFAVRSLLSVDRAFRF